MEEYIQLVNETLFTGSLAATVPVFENRNLILVSFQKTANILLVRKQDKKPYHYSKNAV